LKLLTDKENVAHGLSKFVTLKLFQIEI